MTGQRGLLWHGRDGGGQGGGAWVRGHGLLGGERQAQGALAVGHENLRANSERPPISRGPRWQQESRVGGLGTLLVRLESSSLLDVHSVASGHFQNGDMSGGRVAVLNGYRPPPTPCSQICDGARRFKATGARVWPFRNRRPHVRLANIRLRRAVLGRVPRVVHLHCPRAASGFVYVPCPSSRTHQDRRGGAGGAAAWSATRSRSGLSAARMASCTASPTSALG